MAAWVFCLWLFIYKMEKLTYSEKLRDPRWQKKRLQIMNRDKFACKLCGDCETTLNVHHIEYYNGNPWEIDNSKLITLCEHCHYEIESLKKNNYTIDSISFKNNLIKIYKSAGWIGGSRIMFISHPDLFQLKVYESNNEFITGFNFTDVDDLNSIVRIIKSFVKIQ